MAPPPLAEEPEDEEWLTTYADAITLLMAFFVMLVSFSRIDYALFEEVMSGIQNEIGFSESKETTSSEVKTKIEDIVFEVGMEQQVEVQKDTRGVTIDIASASFFKPGTAIILDAAKPLLNKWAEVLSKIEYQFFMIEIEGHTDDDPINTPQFPSNWELSAGRASATVRYMVEQDLHPFRMKAIGFGDSHPKVPNRDAEGTPIPINQAKNRRVIIRLVPMDKILKDAYQETLLNERLVEEERKRIVEEKARQEDVQRRLREAATEEADEEADEGADEGATQQQRLDNDLNTMGEDADPVGSGDDTDQVGSDRELDSRALDENLE